MCWKSTKSREDCFWRWAERLLWALFVFTLVRNAWLCDDAYIYLRAVEQWWAGHGPVWNAGWRVQVFTSPLWYGLLVLGRGLLRDGYLAALLLGWGFTLRTWHAWSRSRGLRRAPWARALLLTAWLGSNAFMDYTTSGLENALGFWVLTGFLLAYLPRPPRKTWAALNRWAGLLALVRLDLLALIFPAWWWAARGTWRDLPPRRWLRGLLSGAALPTAWYGFAWWYYGTPLPNPAYAKLFHGLPRSLILNQGLRYWLGQFLLDPLTLVGLVGASLALLATRRPRLMAVAWGGVLYALYLTWAGGDFMAGRFPAFAYLWAGAAYLWYLGLPRAARAPRWAKGVFVALLLYMGFFPHTPVNSPWDHYAPLAFYERWGVGDERGRYYRYTSLLTYLVWRTTPDAPPFFPPYAWSQMGYEFRQDERPLAIVDSVGMFGYWAGTEKWVVDVWALTDPFLARLPDADGRLWRPGHYERALPPGYAASLRARENRLADPSLRRLYDWMVTATQAPLGEPARWPILLRWPGARVAPAR